MPSTSSTALRRALVAELERIGAVRTPEVRRAFLRVPREAFVPEIAARDGLARVYANQALATRFGPGGQPTSSSSQPSIMAEMLERLRVRPGQRVLEIGAGTGYNAALLSVLVGPEGHVTSVDVQWDLAEKAGAALRAGGYDVQVVVGDGQRGRYGDGPYDRIIVTASNDHVPRTWLDQLAPGGLLEAPLRLAAPGPWHQLVVTFQRSDDQLRSVAVVWGAFMPVRSADDVPGHGQPSQVSLTELVDGRHHTYGTLTGGALGTLTSTARRRLAALLLTKPRRRTIPTPGGANTTLLPSVALARPRPGALVGYVGDAGRGMGVADPDGRGLSLLVGGAANRCVMLRYGEGADPGILDREVTTWQAQGRPSLDDWRITVTFGARPPAPPGATVLERRQSWLTIDTVRSEARR